MKAVSTDQIRGLDQQTIASGVPGETLMERAGFAVAQAAVRCLPQRRGGARSVLLLAGKGNNGGDAFVAARHLAAAGCEPTLLLLASRDALRGDAATHFQRMIGVNIVDAAAAVSSADPSTILSTLKQLVATTQPVLLIDGLLGTGLTGEVREPLCAVIDWMNHQSRPVLAIDIPSGLDSDTGGVHGLAVRADRTITMGLPKIGLLQPAAQEYVGTVEVADIGFPPSLVDACTSDTELITAADIAPLFPRRRRASHKGDYGHLLIIAGGEGYAGAPVLCAHAAARAGTGLVTLAVPESVYTVVAAQCPPEVMPCRWETLDDLDRFSALAIGPGLGQVPTTQEQIVDVLRRAEIPLVVDADALNAIAQNLQVLDEIQAPAVFTPHPGEMGRLLKCTAADVQTHRWQAARTFSREHGIVLVLKGAGTVVADPNAPLAINLTGNPGMARGGMGDVLTGMIGAFLARGIDPRSAACAGVYMHGAAGDRACAVHGETAMLATDLIDMLGEVFRTLHDGAA